MLADASVELRTAPAVRSDVLFDVSDSATAIDFSASVLSLTVRRTAVAFSRNASISDSISSRRRSCSDSAALFRSASVRSVMSSWVPIQNRPPSIDLLTTATARPSGRLDNAAHVAPWTNPIEYLGTIFLSV